MGITVFIVLSNTHIMYSAGYNTVFIVLGITVFIVLDILLYL